MAARRNGGADMRGAKADQLQAEEPSPIQRQLTAVSSVFMATRIPSLIAVNKFMRFFGTSSGTPEAVLAARPNVRIDGTADDCSIKSAK